MLFDLNVEFPESFERSIAQCGRYAPLARAGATAASLAVILPAFGAGAVAAGALYIALTPVAVVVALLRPLVA